MQPGMRGLATGAAFALAVVAAAATAPSPDAVEQPFRIATTADLTGPGVRHRSCSNRRFAGNRGVLPSRY